MALINTPQLNTLAETILADTGIAQYKDNTKAKLAGMYTEAKEAKVKELTHVFEYLKTYMAISGIKIDLDAALGGRTIETFVSGGGNNGGALASVSGGPVSGSVKSSKDFKGTQSNSGPGRVS